MSNVSSNVVKGWITTVIGTVTTILTLILIYKGVFDFTWEGLCGLSIGALLIIAPKTIESKISQIITGLTNKK